MVKDRPKHRILHSRRVAWSTLNNLTGRSQQSSRQCPVSANAIASQLVKTGKYEETFRLVMQEFSVLWKAIALDAVNIFIDFSPREFAAGLHQLKLSKAPGHDSICPELLIHASPGLKF